MLMIELFSGSARMSKAFKKRGFDIITIDNNSNFKPDICADILNLDPGNLKPLVVWASPPCTAFSVMTISRNFRGKTPISHNAKLGLALLKKTQELIKIWKPKYFFIENPRGMMRNFNFMGKRVTTTYCKYGEKYQKPTDIWTNTTYTPRKACKSGDLCHIRAPQGSKTGLRELKNAYERSKLPLQLCEEIADYCIKGNTQTTLK